MRSLFLIYLLTMCSYAGSTECPKEAVVEEKPFSNLNDDVNNVTCKFSLVKPETKLNIKLCKKIHNCYKPKQSTKTVISKESIAVFLKKSFKEYNREMASYEILKNHIERYSATDRKGLFKDISLCPSKLEMKNEGGCNIADTKKLFMQEIDNFRDEVKKSKIPMMANGVLNTEGQASFFGGPFKGLTLFLLRGVKPYAAASVPVTAKNAIDVYNNSDAFKNLRMLVGGGFGSGAVDPFMDMLEVQDEKGNKYPTKEFSELITKIAAIPLGQDEKKKALFEEFILNKEKAMVNQMCEHKLATMQQMCVSATKMSKEESISPQERTALYSVASDNLEDSYAQNEKLCELGNITHNGIPTKEQIAIEAQAKIQARVDATAAAAKLKVVAEAKVEAKVQEEIEAKNNKKVSQKKSEKKAEEKPEEAPSVAAKFSVVPTPHEFIGPIPRGVVTEKTSEPKAELPAPVETKSVVVAPNNSQVTPVSQTFASPASQGVIAGVHQPVQDQYGVPNYPVAIPPQSQKKEQPIVPKVETDPAVQVLQSKLDETQKKLAETKDQFAAEKRIALENQVKQLNEEKARLQAELDKQKNSQPAQVIAASNTSTVSTPMQSMAPIQQSSNTNVTSEQSQQQILQPQSAIVSGAQKISTASVAKGNGGALGSAGSGASDGSVNALQITRPVSDSELVQDPQTPILFKVSPEIMEKYNEFIKNHPANTPFEYIQKGTLLTIVPLKNEKGEIINFGGAKVEKTAKVSSKKVEKAPIGPAPASVMKKERSVFYQELIKLP